MKRTEGINILGRQFKPQTVPTVVCLFFISLFIVLGFWQIHRYNYKVSLLTRYQHALQQTPENLLNLVHSHSTGFKKVKVEGVYLNESTAFIQNRYAHNHVGFDVLTPMKVVGSSQLLWVNRGWVPFTPHISPPKIAAVKGQQVIVGYVKSLNEYIFTLGKNIVQPNKRPLVMQKVDIAYLEKLTGQRYYPFVVRLNRNQPHGFVRDWKPINVLPARHMGYAVQWFVMALVLAIAYFIFSSRSLSKEDDHAKKIQ